MRRCTVLGAGSWGTALAVQLARQGHDVLLWDRNPERAATIDAEHRNPRYLTTVTLPHGLRATADLAAAAAHAELLVPVIPSHALREVARGVRPTLRVGVVIACATKGIETASLQTMADVLAEELPEHRSQITVLTGPSFALEVANGLPTAVVVAGPDAPCAQVAEWFHGEAFRVYHTEDVIGCCVGGSVKNVMAIACGISDGAGLGANARAAIITRGIAETTRLAVAMGANPLTLLGLAGVGDLVLTCTGDLSRNRRVGIALGQGRKLDSILDELGEVAEGVVTTRSAWQLAQKMGVEMPITEQVHALLFEDRPVQIGLGSLLGRARRAERD
jgi:glycerol-3-phosphate dehydrogenase (NAD(P)+)